jgi:hypothetical protein
MRPPQKNRNNNRHKGGRNKPVGNVQNRVHESAGPEGKVRGTPQQIIEKYMLLARDAQTSGDRVMAENFLQHAEHYIRLLNVAQAQMEERRAQQSDGDNAGDAQRSDQDDDGDDGDGFSLRRANGRGSDGGGRDPGAGGQGGRDQGGRRRNGSHGEDDEDSRSSDGPRGEAQAGSRRGPVSDALATIDTRDEDADPVATPEQGRAAAPDRPRASEVPASPAPASPAPASAEAASAEDTEPAPRRRRRRAPAKAETTNEKASEPAENANG